MTLGIGQIASITGRYYAMDRDNRWDRVQRAYDVICSGDGQWVFETPLAALEAAYARGETDEFVQPTVINAGPRPRPLIDGDQVLFMNFRADRARQLTDAFVSERFQGFDRAQQTQTRPVYNPDTIRRKPSRALRVSAGNPNQ